MRGREHLTKQSSYYLQLIQSVSSVCTHGADYYITIIDSDMYLTTYI